jgi:hypothetical protein
MAPRRGRRALAPGDLHHCGARRAGADGIALFVRRRSAAWRDSHLGRLGRDLPSLLPTTGAPRPAMGFVGGSDALEAIRREIAKVADLDVAVLVRGETGTVRSSSPVRSGTPASARGDPSSTSTWPRSRRARPSTSCSGTRRAPSPEPRRRGPATSRNGGARRNSVPRRDRRHVR